MHRVQEGNLTHAAERRCPGFLFPFIVALVLNVRFGENFRMTAIGTKRTLVTVSFRHKGVIRGVKSEIT